MSLTATVTRSYTMIEGAVPSIDDWNTAFEPQVSVVGSVGTGDIEDGAVTFPKLSPDLLLAGLNAVTQLEGTDILLVGDDSEDANSTITVANFWSSVQATSTVATAFDDYAADTISWVRADTATVQKSTIAYFAESVINQAPLITEPTVAADGILITNASAAAGAKAQLVDLDNLLPAVIAGGTYSNPTAITVRNDGRVTSVNTSSGFLTTIGTASIPAAGDVATIAHGYSAVPSLVRVVLKCLATDRGYAVNDEVPIEYVIWSASDNEIQSLTVMANATAIYVARDALGATIYVTGADGSTSTTVGIDTTKWQIKAYALR